MTPSDSDLVLQLALKKISEQEFLERFSDDPRREGFLRQLLERCLQERDGDLVEDAMILGFRFGFSSDCAEPLNRLLFEPWHHDHEDITLALQKLRDPSSVEPLSTAALADFDYLEYDDNYSLGVKCVHALSKIGTAAAREKLEQLAASDREPIQRAARKQLQQMDG